MAGAAVIGVCAVAMVATGPLGCCMAAVAAKGAFFGAVGGVSSAVSYMEEHGTLDGAGKKILEGVATGFSSGSFSGAISGLFGGAAAYKKNPTGYCFVAGTAVLTTLGYAGIECIRAGDYVYAKDEETGEQEYMPVLDTFTNEVTEICTLTIDGETIETTVGHKFYTVENGWMSAGDLSEGDTVELSDGSSGTVESVEITELEEPVTVYNFCVMDFHTYYVGESEVLVHNTCKKADVNSSGGSSASKSDIKTDKVLGGSFKDVDATRGVDEVGHHMPQYAYEKTVGISRNDGPALLMSKEDHALTRSFAGRGKMTMKEDIGLSARQRMAKDLWDIKNKFGTKYNEGIKQMLEYTKTLPEFQK